MHVASIIWDDFWFFSFVKDITCHALASGSCKKITYKRCFRSYDSYDHNYSPSVWDGCRCWLVRRYKCQVEGRGCLQVRGQKAKFSAREIDLPKSTFGGWNIHTKLQLHGTAIDAFLANGVVTRDCSVTLNSLQICYDGNGGNLELYRANRRDLGSSQKTGTFNNNGFILYCSESDE